MESSPLSPTPGQSLDFECPACKQRHPYGTAYCPNLGTPISPDVSSPVAKPEPVVAEAAAAPIPPPVPATAQPAATAAATAAEAAAPAPAPQVITTKAVDTDRNAGIKVVTIPRVTTYHMPGMCVACGKPLNGSTAKIKASVQQTSGNLRTTLSLDFPLCMECNDVQKLFTKISNKALGIAAAIIGPLAAAFLVIGLLTVKGSDNGGVVGGAVCGGFILWMVVFGILQSVLNKKQPQETQDRHKLIGKAVGITGFTSTSVTFKFASETFATLFESMNSINQDLINTVIQGLLNKKPQ